MTEKGPSWGDMANTTWGDLLARGSVADVPGVEILDARVRHTGHSRADHAMQGPQPIEIDIEQKLLDLIAEMETLKARVAELESRDGCAYY